MDSKQIRLKPEISFRASSTGDKFIAEDRVQQKFWRLGKLEYELCAFLESPVLFEDIAQLTPRASQSLSQAEPDKIAKTVVWLMQSGLVETVAAKPNPTNPDSQPKAPPFKIFDPSFFRVHLLGPDRIEQIAKPFVWLVSYPVLLIAIVLWLAALTAGYQNLEMLTALSGKLFVPGSQWWFLVAWTLLKFIHESGHALACLRVGVRPSSAGVGFIFFTPSPFVNATNSWNLEDRWSRILISAAGILFEATFACVALLVACWSTSPSIQYLCISIVTLGTISTFVFNGNPLMRFDGYYILIDLIGRPNLWQDANRTLKQFAWRLVSKSTSITEIAPILLGYGLVSFFYRMLSLTTIAWGLWVAWDGVGLIVASAFAVLWFVMPRLMKQKPLPKPGEEPKPPIWSEISVKKVSQFAAAGALVVGLGFLPSPVQIYWPGCVDFVDPIEIRTGVPGKIVQVMYHDGQGVRKGDELLRLSNPELELEFAKVEADWKIAQEKCNLLRVNRRDAELNSEESELEACRFRYESFKEKIAQLSIRAPRDGVLLMRGSNNFTGMFVEEGSALGLVVDPFRLEVRASAPADQWEPLAKSPGGEAEILLSNGETWKGELVQILPRTTDMLEFPVLAGQHGGVLTVKMAKGEDGKEEQRTLEPRCQIRVGLTPNSFKRTMLSPNYRPNLPPPGIVCSVKLMSHQESAWETAVRWIGAALKMRFGADSVPS
ncbi:MAG: HlyD family efflux transporter periplasmic adaptor subunit [Pirellula sp.]|nr:HlyD family efflux transporter periplasmic adaptor subunit [Pirellula sp.]